MYGITLNDFFSSTFLAIQIHVSYTEFKNPKISGIQPLVIEMPDTDLNLICLTVAQMNLDGNYGHNLYVMSSYFS